MEGAPPRRRSGSGRPPVCTPLVLGALRRRHVPGRGAAPLRAGAPPPRHHTTQSAHPARESLQSPPPRRVATRCLPRPLQCRRCHEFFSLEFVASLPSLRCSLPSSFQRRDTIRYARASPLSRHSTRRHNTISAAFAARSSSVVGGGGAASFSNLGCCFSQPWCSLPRKRDLCLPPQLTPAAV